MNLFRQSTSKLTSTFDKQPHFITNSNNLNYLSNNHQTNYNTINQQSSARDILQGLKHHERFARNDNPHFNQLNFNSHAADHHQLNTFNGTNYSQNIVNYNNSYYKINNINNFNCSKNQSSSRNQNYHDNYQQSNSRRSSNEHFDLSSSKNKMEREEYYAENSQLMEKTSSLAANERQTDVNNITSNPVKTHTVIPHPYNTADDNENQDNRNHQNFQFQEDQSNRHPIYQSQHFSQVGFLIIRKMQEIDGSVRRIVYAI